MAKESGKESRAGRPTDYDQFVADEICERIIAGDSLNKICKEPGMPCISAVFRWVNKYPEFSDKYAKAREMQADNEFDSMEELAATATPETANVVRLQVDTRKWVLARKSPKKYGDKLTTDVNHSGQVTLTHEQWIGQLN